jgi:hypothetical protein
MANGEDLTNRMIQGRLYMTNTDHEFANLAQELKGAVLMTISVDAQLASICLEFATYNGDVDIKLRFGRVALFNLFKEADEVDCFYIVHAKSEVVQGDITGLSGSLLYQSGQLHQILNDVSTQPLYHLYLEGDISLDLVAAEYERLM